MDKIIVLTTASEEKSAKKLGFPTHTYFNGYKDDYKNHCIIRLGNGFTEGLTKNPIFDTEKDFPNVLNSIESIQGNVKKNEALEKLSKVVNTPRIFKDKTPRGTMVVKRPTAHTGGTDFEVVKGGFKINKGFYCTQFIKTKTEVRVFLCGQKTLTCSRKKSNKQDSDICRSNWDYVNFRKTPIKLHKMCLLAAKTLKLDICALDVLVKNGRYYILELNSAPTLTRVVADFYKKTLPVLIKQKFPKLK